MTREDSRKQQQKRCTFQAENGELPAVQKFAPLICEMLHLTSWANRLAFAHVSEILEFISSGYKRVFHRKICLLAKFRDVGNSAPNRYTRSVNSSSGLLRCTCSLGIIPLVFDCDG